MNKLPIFNKGIHGGMNFEKDSSSSHQYMMFFYLSGIILFFIIILLRLFQLTIVKGSYYRLLSERNRVKEILIEPQRGEIKDRKGFIVAHNTPADIHKTDERIKSNRIYENGEVIAPLIGYRQIADQNDFKNDNCIHPLQLGDKIGKKGVEKLFDCELRGKYGKKLIETDAKGNYVRTITVLPPETGQTVQLSFDLDLQQKTYELLKDKKAAAVGMNPKTGEILFMVSTPSFNPQAFEDSRSEQIQTYFSSEDKPMVNRATEGLYPPGSLFKLVLAVGALEEKTIDEKTLFEDTGQLQAGPLKFGNWYFLQYGKTDGMVDIVKAIRRSNDIFFYKTGEGLGPDRIKKWASYLGYGKETGIGLNEGSGMIPSSFWKQETLHDRWYTGDTYNLSIGQGYVTVTPLQTVMTTSVFANGGYLCKPQLSKIQNSELSIQNCKKLPISQKTLNLIRQGMKEACSTGGTGWPLFDFKVKDSTSSASVSKPIQVACKTGTAESQQAKSSVPHAWITAFAPYDPPAGGPQIALTVLVEESGQGSDIAGPIARDILKAYFERKE